IQVVVSNGIYTGTLKHVEQIKSLCNCFSDYAVYLGYDKVVRMFVITAEHNITKMIRDDRTQGLKILCRRAFPDQNLHSVFQLFPGFLLHITFVICRYSCINVLLCLLTHNTGGVSVYGTVKLFCNGDLAHYNWIFVK